MTKTKELTVESLIAEHAEDIAFAAEQDPATTLDDFVGQLQTAARYLGPRFAAINGAEDLDTAATYLANLEDADEKRALLKKVGKLLGNAWEMVEEYREMV